RLKCTLVRHRKSLLVCGAAAADRGDRPEEFAELPEAAADEPCADPAAGEGRGAEIARVIREWVEEEAALAELGLTPDGLPDPAVWGEEAVTDPEGLLAQIAAGRKPPQSGPLAPRAEDEDRSHSERTTLPGVGADGLVVLHRPGDGQGEDFPQPAAAADVGPVLEDGLRLPAAGPGVVLDQQGVNPLVIDVGAVDHRDALAVQLGRGLVLGVEDEQLAAGHPGADLVLDRPEDQHPAAGHVLAGVLASRLGDDRRPGVADAEPVPGPAADEDEPAGRPVADVVAGDRLNLAAVVGGGVVEGDDDGAAGDPLGDAVLGV